MPPPQIILFTRRLTKYNKNNRNTTLSVICNVQWNEFFEEKYAPVYKPKFGSRTKTTPAE